MKATLEVINRMQADGVIGRYAIALQLGHAKDQARILQFTESGTLDAVKLDTILSRHGLLEKWERFGCKFLEDKP